MNTILRHVFTAILFSFILSIIITGITLVAFLEDWSLILDHKVGEISYLAMVLIIPIVSGIIIGTVSAWYWQQRVRRIERQLDELAKGQKMTFDQEPYAELDKIQHYLEQVQEKINSQTEMAQRIATERAVEREKSLQEVVVQERNRLARELHDSVSQQLFAASMMMSAINETNPPKDDGIRKQLHMIEKAIHQSQSEMRALLLHLRPVALKGKNLQAGVEELLLELIQKVPMQIDWKVEAFTVDKGIEDQLFRILQESVSNILRHAKATSLYVMLIERDDTVILRVADDGIGFDINKIKTSSYGVENMRERAYEIGGTLKVISLPNEGTRLEVKVPILRKEGENHD
ncbi:NarL family two-component system sensor histidine kinase LiaS [Virgibacillus halotolerans]|uniref:sensor histidine kinase n=1 Tax=Virgibacillus halotolerans TaxID=1071053 RepID=UPI00196029E9|nr:sensor histidine kinase [Virgibacillus halotolerans]MBM7600629.1 NarL family two-component system sensor histidine kinase LiaS [Virgibacillus halotolerans]